jgi:cold shock protein
MPTGVIKFFNRRKGFGFIVDNETQAEIFVHASGLTDKKVQLKPKDNVSYEVNEDEDGKKKAANVEKII